MVSVPILQKNELIVLCGFPASGKSTLANQLFASKGYSVYSRDTYGGKASDLLRFLDGSGNKIVIDNTNLTPEARKPFIDWAKEHGLPVVAVVIDTTIEDCQIRHLRRMYQNHGRLFFDAKDLKEYKKSSPDLFPSAVFFKAKKQWVPPTSAEGFDHIIHLEAPNISYDKSIYNHSALFVDIDGTLIQYPPPRNPEDLEFLRPVSEIKKLFCKYNFVIGVSNQSSIGSGKETVEEVEQRMETIRKKLKLSSKRFIIRWCPHRAGVITCFCRKPQSGLGIEAIEKYKLDPEKCLMIGDKTTDRTFARRLGIEFQDSI
jgi:D-sedoheptulose 7-phosphate isomerase/D-glycero-D-manno-heptose 1,7-bisphosphate phosphatase